MRRSLYLMEDTPSYIWKVEAGCRRIEIDTWKRAATYISDAITMRDDRKPKKCLKEEVF